MRLFRREKKVAHPVAVLEAVEELRGGREAYMRMVMKWRRRAGELGYVSGEGKVDVARFMDDAATFYLKASGILPSRPERELQSPPSRERRDGLLLKYKENGKAGMAHSEFGELVAGLSGTPVQPLVMSEKFGYTYHQYRALHQGLRRFKQSPAKLQEYVGDYMPNKTQVAYPVDCYRFPSHDEIGGSASHIEFDPEKLRPEVNYVLVWMDHHAIVRRTQAGRVKVITIERPE